MPEEGKEALSERKRVLIVDDDERDSSNVSEILQKGGFEPIVSENYRPVQVITAIESQAPIDLIISDGLTGGWEQIKNIARQKDIPFLLITRDGGYLNEAREAGFKGIDRSSLERDGDEWSFADWLKENFFDSPKKED